MIKIIDKLILYESEQKVVMYIRKILMIILKIIHKEEYKLKVVNKDHRLYIFMINQQVIINKIRILIMIIWILVRTNVIVKIVLVKVNIYYLNNKLIIIKIMIRDRNRVKWI